MTRGSSIGANDLTRAPHHASYATLVRRDSSFLPARTSFKLAKFAQAVLDVFAASYWLLYVALWIVVILGILPFTVFCLLLVKF